ncbi:restriction endonuclease subunit S [Helicobacter pylori]|uniref:restriction endonuclease subunit S n=1 Tax=Helicobacter pylori TaxID=210 RepID=UPI000D3BE3E4|nr:restriction endonuclease subunit S [Helicobacter pylori]PUD50473.1 restriction endonuclease [Helicobacter pylori]WRG91048.1 restriction endonuclease subunit S [Helicobacter pylori]
MDALATPSNWQRVRLGDIFFITAGGDLSKLHYSNTKQSDCNYPIYSNAIEKKGLYGYSSFFIIKNKSITITARGTIGVAFFRDYPYVPIGRLLVLQPKISNIDCRFYAEYINSKVEFNTEQTTIPQLTIPKVALCEIPLPPLNEQIAIANILSDVDRYLYSLDALILKKESIKKALSFELLSQRKRLKGFSQAWQRVRLGDIAEIKRGASPRPIENPKWFCTNSNVGWVRISDISKNSRFLYKTAQKLSKKGIEKSRFIKQNSLIMSMCATIGKPIITKIDTCIHDGFVVFENPKIDLNYLYYFLCYIEKEWLESGQQGSQVNLNVDLIKNKEVFCPKDLNEQAAIANILSGLDHEIISLKNKKRQFENIKKALNHDLMSAKIRVLKK